MKRHISRRNALKAGAASMGGAVLGAACSDSGNETAETAVSQGQSPHPPFLTPWSRPPGYTPHLTAGSTPIRLAAWKNDTVLAYPRDESITDVVKRIHDQGYTAANASYGQSRKNPWLEAPESDIRELKDALAAYDVLFFDMHTYTNNIHPDPAKRKENHRYVIEQCEAAERVGCTMVTTHTGTMSDDRPISPHPGNWTWDTWKLSVSVIRQLLSDTSGMNVRFGIEAVNMTASNNPRAHRQLLDEVADPRLRICLDPVNMMHLAVYYRNSELIEECFDLLGDDIIAAHAKDTWVLPDRMSAYITEVAPGKGILDYGTYLRGLSGLSTPCPLIIEHIPAEEFAGAKAYLEETAAKVGVRFHEPKTG